MNHTSSSSADTAKVASGLAKEFSKPRTKGIVLALTGELGAGKTTFVQGLAKTLGSKTKPLSPTFVLMRSHKINKHGLKRIYHLDAYRLNSEKEAAILKLEDLFRDPGNLVLIEWAEKVRNIIPKDAVWIKFEHGGSSRERKITIPKSADKK